ncbi:major facilitator superfamily transporter [Westerdykella ornata]|uniref:Major facilitator superfamily transporter n=1 Tax=Westerdykella ornata TaxID=318751 RepID=A0A6A6JUL2_WESOR|nr:major facilitator superfamily transporter [Westerdykella ornata]KAF2279508.1 major facilitator superfamily transporter [Westerdykella ornata]
MPDLSLFTSLVKGAGVYTVLKSTKDVKLLFLQRFIRLFAYGASYIILVHFLANLGISDEHVGLFMTLTMLGDVAISFVLTIITDQVGRRKVLAAGALLMGSSGIVFALSSRYWALLLASIVGVISPSGNEIGPFRAVEESILSQLTDKDDRSDIFVWYTMCGTAGAALGTVTSGWMIHALTTSATRTELEAYRVVFILYAALGFVKMILTLLLSRKVELERKHPAYHEILELENEELLTETSSEENEETTGHIPKRNNSQMYEPAAANGGVLSRLGRRARSLLPRISSQSLSILSRLILLFALDSFASGMASPSWLTYFFTTYHKIGAGALGTLFFTTNILATLSNFTALPLARRLGPLKTMTFTHLPSAIFLGLVPLPKSGSGGTWIAMAFLSLRACTQSMDQAPRQAFLAAAVRNEERTAILGVVNIVKTIAQAGGIGSSGFLAGKKMWVVMLSGAGLMKAGYDLLILWTFLGLPERER